jgi:hypothetical protein
MINRIPVGSLALAAAVGLAGLAATAAFAPAEAQGGGRRFSSAGAAVRHAAGPPPAGVALRPPGHGWGYRPYHGPRPWPYTSWYRPYRWYGYGVVPFGVGVGVGLSSWPYYWGYVPPPQAYYAPYPPAPGFPYPAPYPPLGAVCVAGTVTCPLEGPATPGDACNCPTPAGRAWGRVGG